MLSLEEELQASLLRLLRTFIIPEYTHPGARLPRLVEAHANAVQPLEADLPGNGLAVATSLHFFGHKHSCPAILKTVAALESLPDGAVVQSATHWIRRDPCWEAEVLGEDAMARSKSLLNLHPPPLRIELVSLPTDEAWRRVIPQTSCPCGYYTEILHAKSQLLRVARARVYLDEGGGW